MSDHRARAAGHAKRAYYCTCGKVVHGNGARFQHGAMHNRQAAMNPAAWLGQPIVVPHYVTREAFAAAHGGMA